MTSHATTDIAPVSPPNTDDTTTAVRLTLHATQPGAAVTTLDGAWWPHSRSLTDELPDLITELHRRGLRMTRAVYNPASWDPAPRRLSADGRVIRLGWFRSIDPHLVSLTSNYGATRLELLVVPPDAAPGPSAAAMDQATSPGNRSTPTAVLTAADVIRVGHQSVGPRARRSRLATGSDPDTTAWESEGGHLRR